MMKAIKAWAGKALRRGAGGSKKAALSRRLAFIAEAEFPEGALARVALAFPSFGPEQLRLCEQGFRQYASACALEGLESGVAMPSKAVDELWHQLMLHSRFYHEFCQEAFGGYLHHEPGPLAGAARSCARPERAPCAGGGGRESNEKGDLARAWRGAARVQGLEDSGIPLLFQADALTGVPQGFIYSELDELSAVPISALRAWAKELPGRSKRG